MYFMNKVWLFFNRMFEQKIVFGGAIGSLCIGIVVAFLIGLWVLYELSFDNFHTDVNQIYRVYVEEVPTGGRSGLAFALVFENQSIPEIRRLCRMTEKHGDIKIDQVQFLHEKILLTDTNFFSFFTFPLKYGDCISCLNSPDKVVISERISDRWFGQEDPIGKTILLNDQVYQISGVMENIPYNSHIQADIVSAFKNKGYDYEGNYKIYVDLPLKSDIQEVENKLTQLHHHILPVWKESQVVCKLLPLSDIHFSDISSAHQGNRSLVVVVSIAAMAVLIIACINFINLFIAISSTRFREIGVRKTFGAGKKDVIWSFYREVAAYVSLAMGIAVLIGILCLPLIRQLTGYPLTLDITSSGLYFFIAGILLFTLLSAGTYPAFYMSGFSVIEVVKGTFKGRNVSFLQKTLLFLQFSVSMFFLMSIFFIARQVDYMMNYDLGFNKENILYVNAPAPLRKHYDALKNELMKDPDIENVTMRNRLPFEWAEGEAVKSNLDGSWKGIEVCEIMPDYFDIMGIKIVEGEVPKDMYRTNSILIDKRTVKELGLTDPLGMRFKVKGREYVVKGVVENIRKNLKDSDIPIFYLPYTNSISNTNNYFILCRVSGNMQKAIAMLEKQCKSFMPGGTFQYGVLSDTYEKLYDSEVRLKNIVTCVMVFMIFLTVIGIFAIAYYSLQRQVREIGIRRINGATDRDIWVLSGSLFFKLFLVSFVVSCGLSYYFMKIWLNNFVDKADLSYGVWGIVGLLAIGIMLLPISYISSKACRLNPIETLKSE